MLSNVVAGIYAPLIHSFSNSVLQNINSGVLPPVIVAPPRDAIPLVSSLKAMAALHGQDLLIFEPPVNRNTTGIANNQKKYFIGRSPYLDQLLDETVESLQGSTCVMEVETGIYGTTSLVMAAAFKSRKLDFYYPLKFYGLGPNLSFVHAVLSDGKQWVAQDAEDSGLVSRAQINGLMVLLDTMEELGMEKFYQSVEQLQVGPTGKIEPVFMPVSGEDLEVATVTNQVITDTAPLYVDLTPGEVKAMLANIPVLVKYSQQGFPFTLSAAIPSMDSKDAHFESIRTSKLFDYPLLEL